MTIAVLNFLRVVRFSRIETLLLFRFLSVGLLAANFTLDLIHDPVIDMSLEHVFLLSIVGRPLHLSVHQYVPLPLIQGAFLCFIDLISLDQLRHMCTLLIDGLRFLELADDFILLGHFVALGCDKITQNWKVRVC